MTANPQPGSAFPIGATTRPGGVNFSVYADKADAVELLLFDGIDAPQPAQVIRLEDAGGVRRTIITGTVVKEQPLLACSECGAPTTTPAHRDYVRQRLPEHMAALLERELCPACARGRADRPRWGLQYSAP